MYSHYFSRYNGASFNSNLGLSLQEFCYVVDTYCSKSTVSPLEFMMALHFAWKYPEGNYGAVIWNMCRQTYAFKVWKAINTMEAFMDEIKMENRLKSAIFIDGPAAYCSLHTDSSDFMINRPKDKTQQKKHWTFKRRKFAMRYAIAVAANTGDLCWLSSGYPAGSISDLNINRGEGLVERLQFFERVGADGAYLCRRDPMYKCPHRKPRGGQLTDRQVHENDAFGNCRSIVENVFARTKQFACMTKWRHKRDQHPIMARFVFQLIQVKQKFRPIRRLGVSSQDYSELAAATWQDAEHEGVPVPVVPESKKAKRRPERKRKSSERRSRTSKRKRRRRGKARRPARSEAAHPEAAPPVSPVEVNIGHPDAGDDADADADDAGHADACDDEWSNESDSGPADSEPVVIDTDSDSSEDDNNDQRCWHGDGLWG
ncbi:hypothetical protein AAMO2058_000698600 [Amorphochlora amoebiformis]